MEIIALRNACVVGTFRILLKCQEIIRNPVRFINKKLISNGVEVCFYELLATEDVKFAVNFVCDIG